MRIRPGHFHGEIRAACAWDVCHWAMHRQSRPSFISLGSGAAGRTKLDRTPELNPHRCPSLCKPPAAPDMKLLLLVFCGPHLAAQQPILWFSLLYCYGAAVQQCSSAAVLRCWRLHWGSSTLKQPKYASFIIQRRFKSLKREAKRKNQHRIKDILVR